MRLAATVGLSAAGLVAVATFWAQDGGDAAELPPPVTAGPAHCPPTRDVSWRPALSSTRGGDLLPLAPRRALLCVYPAPGVDAVSQLSETHVIEGATAREAVAYLNSLPSDTGDEVFCFGAETAMYTTVFDYAEGHASVSIGCGVEYAGGVRPEVNIKKLVRYWFAE